ncbi:MAG: hypothetical protein JWN04_2398 [Myxococcaceae bacterium]|nr:hypothetical protein [Myxococcaceae bacterium]
MIGRRGLQELCPHGHIVTRARASDSLTGMLACRFREHGLPWSALKNTQCSKVTLDAHCYRR